MKDKIEKTHCSFKNNNIYVKTDTQAANIYSNNMFVYCSLLILNTYVHT